MKRGTVKTVPFYFEINSGVEATMRKIRTVKGLAMLLGVTVVCTACSATWISEAEQIVTVLIPAIANVVTLVATLQGSVSATDLNTIQNASSQAEADLQLVRSLIAQYQKADAVAQPG